MRSSLKACNISILRLCDSHSVKYYASVIKVVTMKILCLIALLCVVPSHFKVPGDITGTWTFTEVYSDDMDVLNLLYLYGNCMKIHIIMIDELCRCLMRDLPTFQITMTIKKKMSLDIAIYFFNNYKEFEETVLKTHGRCKCKQEVYWARLLSNNYLLIYDTSARLRPNVILITKNVSSLPKEIEDLEASNEELYNRSHAVACSITNRQFYSN